MGKNKVMIINGMIALFLVTVLATPVLARMGGGHREGGTGGSTDGYGGRGHDSDSQWNRNSKRSMKDYPAEHSFEPMQRMSYRGMNDGDMWMDLEPYSYSKGVFTVRFYANTQNGSLSDYPVMESMYLEYKNVKYEPVAINHMRGQHAEGKIEFHLPEAPDHFHIVVHGFPDSEEHIFEW